MHVEWFVIFLTVFVSSSYPKIDDEGHFAQIYHGWPVMDTFFCYDWLSKLPNKNLFHYLNPTRVLGDIPVNLPN